MTADRKGNIWYATGYPEEGIVQFDGSDFIFHPAPDSTLFFPTALAIDISDNLWVCWENGLAEYSNNNWSVYKDSINYDFSDMVIDKQNNIWLSTFGDGVVLFNKNGIILSVDESKIDEIVNYFSLSQNYPNPFNPSTKISWQSPVGSQQKLKIYDVLGNEVATLVNEYKSAGSYEVDFNASSLSSGIYFYRLTVGSFVQTKKMILMK
ncbi:MAG: T9SS type A sorting domain-containing protein [Ignavibacteriales bacterium]|nr:T9SS type A sorting domain-containing protein [Ignavibacteriales bacterium]